jgi:hypothetical protein
MHWLNLYNFNYENIKYNFSFIYFIKLITVHDWNLLTFVPVMNDSIDPICPFGNELKGGLHFKSTAEMQ